MNDFFFFFFQKKRWDLKNFLKVKNLKEREIFYFSNLQGRKGMCKASRIVDETFKKNDIKKNLQIHPEFNVHLNNTHSTLDFDPGGNILRRFLF